MIRKLGYFTLGLVLTSALHAQTSPTAPRDHDIYCAGGFTTTPPPSGSFIVSGVESATRITFSQGDLVYINRGSTQGVQVGSEFLVSRPVKDRLETKWFVWQRELMHAMGQAYEDVGRIRVVHVDKDTSTAEIELFCDQMQRGDIIQPFSPRPAPNYKPDAKLDMFAAPSGKDMAMIVTTSNFGQIASTGKIVYVNLGSAQGVHVGDYYRVFRYEGDRHSSVYVPVGQTTDVFGYGKAPGSWKWTDLPREVLGEGMVLNVSPNSSTVLITNSQREIYAGDYIEIE